ncbi:polyketide cyclase [Chitinophaga oryziterrae]|uniref:Polyketide cyclase n=1 Tax=Chitinophaga oryziterrae TaxID=1031224 RepID=A0A6N8JBY4_9BACT|nr:ester cyclase [Chitinophaga oryziterrae]MVT42051.1 polyketide cyclase [Chitinophaga oryziterrae]
MENKHFKPVNDLLFLVVVTITVLSGCSNNKAGDNAANAETAILLQRFDSLDFDIYSHQKWDSLQLSHAENILVHYPDGSTTKGLHDHIEQLKPMFVFAPDTKITEHPVKFGTNGWTSVIGIMEGTFTQPMPIGNGKTIPPTGKKFRLEMNTVANWKNGKMIEEYLFWDNQSFMKQIGLAQ